MSKSIRLSQKHGVNPSVFHCFVCGEAVGVALFGRLKGDAEAPRSCVLNREPCDKCKEWMRQGVILISVDPEKTTDEQNPYRTGGWVVVKDEAIERLPMDEHLRRRMLRQRVAFVEDEVWDMVGLPRGDKEGGNADGPTEKSEG